LNFKRAKKYEQALSVHVDRVRGGLSTVYAEYAAEVAGIRRSTAALATVLIDEASARTQLLQDESAARARILERESSARTQVLQQESSSRVKRRLWISAIGGASLGAAVATAIALRIGG
jgi:hypothetical protein